MAIYKYQKSFLVLLGCGIILFSLILIGCSFDINYDDDFQDDDGLEASVEGVFSYYQYWAGLPFLATGGLVLLLANNQRSEALAVITLIFCVVSMGLTLLVLSLSAASFSHWHSVQSLKLYYDSKDGYYCHTAVDSKSCKCTNVNDEPTKYISGIPCGTVSKLSGLYGSLVVSSIIIAVCCVFSVIIIAKFSLQEKPYTQFGHDGGSVNIVPIAPSFVELPVATH